MGLVDTRLNIHYFPETIGLVNQIDRDKNKKLFFFEVDEKSFLLNDEILGVYKKYNLTVLVHQTRNGYHFLSPTLISLELWKEIHQELIHLNPKCPMITLRVQGNKHPNESDYFYRYEVYNNYNRTKNIRSVCLFLNKIFGSDLLGDLDGELQTVRYKPHLRDND